MKNCYSFIQRKRVHFDMDKEENNSKYNAEKEVEAEAKKRKMEKQHVIGVERLQSRFFSIFFF